MWIWLVLTWPDPHYYYYFADRYRPDTILPTARTTNNSVAFALWWIIFYNWVIKGFYSIFLILTQPVFTYSKSTMETPEHCVNFFLTLNIIDILFYYHCRIWTRKCRLWNMLAYLNLTQEKYCQIASRWI